MVAEWIKAGTFGFVTALLAFFWAIGIVSIASLIMKKYGIKHTLLWYILSLLFTAYLITYLLQRIFL